MIIVFCVDRYRDAFTYLVSGHSLYLSISLDAFMNVISVERERGR